MHNPCNIISSDMDINEAVEAHNWVPGIQVVKGIINYECSDCPAVMSERTEGLFVVSRTVRAHQTATWRRSVTAPVTY